nr:ribosomal protein S3 [Morchella brunnea]UBU98354.1 ribosomal protein S3 [Morchella brunnea]
MKNPNINPVAIYSNAELQQKGILSENKGKSGVYCWTNLENGNYYVGSSVNLKNRFNHYFSKGFLEKNKGSIINQSQLKNGYSNFKLENLEYCDPDKAIAREQYYLDFLKPDYNVLHSAGSRLGSVVLAETRKQISSAMTGRKLTEATKAKMVSSWKDREISEARTAHMAMLNEKANSPERIEQSIKNLSKYKAERSKATPLSSREGLHPSFSKRAAVKVTDLETGNFVEYESISQTAEVLGSNKSTERNYLKSLRPFQGKYRFSVISRGISTICAQKISDFKIHNTNTKQISAIIPEKNLDNYKQVSIKKHFAVATKEWHNSVYTYNSKSTISLLVIDQMIIKIITSYLNSFYLEDKKKNHFPAKLVRQKLHSLYMNKVYVSKPELKHTNSKVIITLYVYASRRKTFDWLYKYIDDRMFNQLDYKNQFYLSTLISKFYNKKVVFRIIQLRYFHLNPSILAEQLAISLTNRRTSVLGALRNTLKKVRKLNYNKFDKNSLKRASLNATSNVSMESYKKNQLINKDLLKHEILASLKYRSVIGVRFEIAGRLTKRNTAARSVHKVGQKGIMKNIESSFKGRSTVLLRGAVRPNLDFASISSKTRNGAFNIKCWVSNHYSTLAYFQ